MSEYNYAELMLNGAFDRRRWPANGVIRQHTDLPMQTTPNTLDLVHNLGIHQAALEMQNKDLKRAQQELSTLYAQFEDLYEFAPCGYLNLNPKGLITRINLAGTTLLQGYSQTLQDSDFCSIIAPGWKERYFEALGKADQLKEKQGLELHLAVARGIDKWVWAEIQAGHNRAGELLQWRMTLVDISAKKGAESALAASERKYRQLFDETVTGVALLEIVDRDKMGRIKDLRILEVNAAFERWSGVSGDRLVGNSIRSLWPRTEDSWFDLGNRVIKGDRNVEAQGFHRESGRYMIIRAFQLDIRRIGITMIDISAQKRIEEALEMARLELENKVRERTAEIQRVNRELRKEVEARKIVEKELLEKSQELEIRTVRLEEANTTLKVLLRERDSERRELEEKVASNINELIRPHLAKLRAGNLSERRQALLDAIGRGLEDITSPLSRRFIMECSRLTPMETQVAGLIRQGRTTKEISDLLGVAPSTVDYHRFNIRRKLDLTNKRTNLQSYLKSLS